MRKNKTTHMMAGILIILFTAVFLVVIGRFLYIQATGEVNNVSLEEWAEQKRTSSYSIAAERGKIYDKNGMVLAYDRPTYRMYAIIDEAYSENLKNPNHVTDPQGTAKALAGLLDVEEDTLLESLQKGIENNRFQVEFGSIGKHLSQQKKEEIEALELPGIKFEEEAIRYYPNGVFASHIIGFARETDVDTEDGVKRKITGVTGIEKEMDELLQGKDGSISYQRDRYNFRLLNPNELIEEPEDGDDVYLTLDQKIQTLLDEALSAVEAENSPEKMTGIVMSAKTGEVLAMSSRPSYNPNNPSDVKNWYNDVVSAPIEPGSTVKMFTWAAAIEEGVYNGSEGFLSGTYHLGQGITPVRDVNGGRGWGIIPFDEGFERSSNVAASKLVWEKLGPDKFLEYLHAFDFNKQTGIDLPGEAIGTILYNWPREKISTSFGQGSTTTPIQMMKAATAIANDGKMMQPYVISKFVDSTTGETIEEKEPAVVSEPISPETAKQVRGLLQLAVEGENATGKQFQLEDYSIGGKTGTAQIPNPNGGGYLKGGGNYIYSFLGMAPIEDPDLVIFVSVQQPKLEAGQMGADPVSFIVKNVVENSLHYLNINPEKNEETEIERTEMPKLIGESTESVLEQLNGKGLNVTAIGSGAEIAAANVKQGELLLPNNHIILLTDEPLMPDLTGWSRREVLQFADLLDIQLEISGNGYVEAQSLDEGTPLQRKAYLSVDLLPPEEGPNSDESLEETDLDGDIEETEELDEIEETEETEAATEDSEEVIE